MWGDPAAPRRLPGLFWPRFSGYQLPIPRFRQGRNRLK
jgi:hypothetical protein